MSWDFFLSAGTDDLPVEGIRKGTIAQWRGAVATDFGPAIDPLNNLGDVRFHSDFDYLRFVRKVSSRDAGRSPITVGATGSETLIDRSDVLFAHEMDPPPLVIGTLETGGYKQPLAGSVTPLPGGDHTKTNWRMCSLAVDDTNVMLRIRGGYAPAMLLHWEVWLLNEAFQVRSGSDYMVYLDPEEIDGEQIGKVSSEYRFLSQAEGAGELRLLGGTQTLLLRENGLTDGSDGETDFIIPSTCSAWTNATSWGGWPAPPPEGDHHVNGAEVDL